MRQIDSLPTDDHLSEPLGDVLQQFTASELRRFPCAQAQPNVPQLAQTYADRIFRARRKAVAGELQWTALILRFGEKLFVYARADEPAELAIFAEREAEATALGRRLAQEFRSEEGLTFSRPTNPQTLCLPPAF